MKNPPSNIPGVDAPAKQDTTKLLAALRDDDGTINDKLYRLAQIVRLAAFAAEAQRCLEAYNEGVARFPDCQRHISQTTTAINSWTCHEVNVSDVLTDVAHQMEQIGQHLDMRMVRGPLAEGEVAA